VDQQGATGDALRRFAIRAGIYAGVFLAGAIGAFVYSYVPLHNAKNWRIDYLEERLATKDAENQSLREKIEQLQGSLSDVPDGDTFKVLQAELVTADKTVSQLEKQVAKLEKRAKEAEQARDTWKSRHAESERQRLAARTESTAPPASPASPASPAAVDDDTTAASASPSARAVRTPVSSGTAVDVGSRWQSPDGKSDFDLVAINSGKARVVPDASKLSPGVVPRTVEVGTGGHFEIAAAGGAQRKVVIRGIEGSARIFIDVLD